MCQTSPRTQKFKEMVFLLSNFEPTSETDTRMKIIVVIKVIELAQWVNNGCHLLCAYYVLRIILSTLHDCHLIPHPCPVIEVLISSSFYREEKWVIERLSNLPNVIRLTSRKSEIRQCLFSTPGQLIICHVNPIPATMEAAKDNGWRVKDP